MMGDKFTVDPSDRRTPMWVKHAYTALLLLVTVILLIYIPVRSLWDRKPCTIESSTKSLWMAFHWITFIGTLVTFGFGVYFCVYWRYAWMQTIRHRTGVDVEDIDPFILARTGTAIASRGGKTYQHMLDIMDHPPPQY